MIRKEKKLGGGGDVKFSPPVNYKNLHGNDDGLLVRRVKQVTKPHLHYLPDYQSFKTSVKHLHRSQLCNLST